MSFAPVSALMPGMIPASPMTFTIGEPSFVRWRIVSSYKIAPLMHSPRPGVVTINSRQARRASSV